MQRPTLIIAPFSNREAESHGVYADSEANPAWTTGDFDFCLNEADKFVNGDHALDGQREYKDARILIRCATGTIEVTDIKAGGGRYI